jgi:hypothetical protein
MQKNVLSSWRFEKRVTGRDKFFSVLKETDLFVKKKNQWNKNE